MLTLAVNSRLPGHSLDVPQKFLEEMERNGQCADRGGVGAAQEEEPLRPLFLRIAYLYQCCLTVVSYFFDLI